MPDEKDGTPSQQAGAPQQPQPTSDPAGSSEAHKPAVISPPAEPESEQNIESNIERAVGRSLRWPETIMAAFTVVIAFATIANVIVAFRQWGEMHSGGVDTHNLAIAAKEQAKATDSLAKATTNLLGAGRDQAAAAKSQALAMDRLRRAGELQAEATQNLVKTNRDQLAEMREGQRARIAITDISATGAGLFVNENGRAEISLIFRLKNAGKTDAEYVYPFGQFFIRTYDEKKPKRAHETAREVMIRGRDFCALIRKRPMRIDSSGISIGADQDITEIGNYVMQPSDLQTWRDDLKRGWMVAPMVAGCVDYFHKGEHHQTTFVAEVDKLRAGPNPFAQIDPADMPLTPDKLAIGINPGLAGRSD